MRIAWAMLAAVLLGGCAKKGEKAAVALDAEIARMVPHDTIGLAAIDMDAVRKSPLYQKHVSALPELELAVAAIGLDPRKDVSQLVVTTDGKRMLAIARGTFDRDKLAEKIAGLGAAKSESNGWVLFTRGGRAAGFPSATIAVAGSTEGVNAAMTRGAQNAGLPPHLEKLARGVPAGTAMWGVHWGAVTTPLPQTGNLANLNKLLGAMDTVVAWAKAGEDLEFSITGDTADEASAKKLQAQIKGIVGLGRLTTPDDQPEMLKVYDGIEVSVEGKQVRTRATIAGAQVDRLVPLATRLRKERFP